MPRIDPRSLHHLPSERVTIDLGLRFAGHDRRSALPGIAVVEVKPAGFSKYCIGVSLLFPHIQQLIGGHGYDS